MRCPLGFEVAAVKRLENSRISRLLRSLCSLAMTRILANSKLAPAAATQGGQPIKKPDQQIKANKKPAAVGQKIKSAFLTSAPYLPYLPLCAYHERFLQHFCQR